MTPTPSQTKAAKQFANAFPEIKEHLAGMLQQGVQVSPGRWVFQKDYANQDNHVWLIDTNKNTHRPPVKLPAKLWHFALRGVIVRKDALLLVLARFKEISLVLVDAKGARVIDRMLTKKYQDVSARQSGGEKETYFVVHTGHAYHNNFGDTILNYAILP